MVTSASFRAAFPEFSDTIIYPDAQINFWLGLAASLLNPDAWQDMLDYGTQLYIAHHLVIGARDQQVSAAGGNPGAVQGPIASKSVDKVSMAFDAQSVVMENGGFWNLTRYGIQFLTMARYVGAGGIQT